MPKLPKKPNNFTERQQALKLAENLLIKLVKSPLTNHEQIQLKQLKELTSIIAKLKPKETRNKIIINTDQDKDLYEDFLSRKLSEKYNGDRLNLPE